MVSKNATIDHIARQDMNQVTLEKQITGTGGSALPQMQTPKLQLALDTLDLISALAPLQKAAPYLDVIEVGTILCLAEGMHAVRIIRSLFPDKIILADVRIAEAGSHRRGHAG